MSAEGLMFGPAIWAAAGTESQRVGGVGESMGLP